MRYATFNRFEIEMPDDAVRDCSHQGRCDDDVTYWEQKIRIDASAEDIRNELREYGAWEAQDLEDDKVNRQRIIWIAAGNIKDGCYS